PSRTDGPRVGRAQSRGPAMVATRNVSGYIGTLLICSALAVLGACSRNNPMEPAKPSPALILFRSIRSGHFNIHAMNSDGTEATALTNDTLGDGDAKWSPDGTRIVLTKSFDIYTMNPNGTGLVRLTDGFRTTPPSYSIQPAWSADGKKIAFVTDRGSPGPGVGLMEMYVMNVD